MTATPAVLDFKPRYDSGDLDQLAREVAESLSEITGQSAAEIALTTRRLLQMAAEHEDENILISEGKIVVHRSDEDELRVFLELGVVRAVTQ